MAETIDELKAENERLRQELRRYVAPVNPANAGILRDPKMPERAVSDTLRKLVREIEKNYR